MIPLFTMQAVFDQLRFARHEIVEKLNNAFKVGVITDRERNILYSRILDWNSLEKVSKEFGVTRERIRQIEAKAMEKIRQYEQEK